MYHFFLFSPLSFFHPVRGQIQNLFLTAQSTQIKSVISVPIKDFIHHYPRALFNDIPRVGAYFYDIPGSGHIPGLFSDDYSPKSANMMNVILHYLPCYQVVLYIIYGFIMNHSPYWLVVKISIFMIFRTCQCWHRSLLNLWSGCYSININKI